MPVCAPRVRRPPASTSAAVRGQGLEGPRPEPPPGGRKPSTSRPSPDAATPRPGVVLLVGRQRVPALVAPAVQPDLVAGRRDVAQRVGIELGVEPLDEERRAQVERGERPARAAARRSPRGRAGRGALEVGGLAEVVEAQQDRVAQLALTPGRRSRRARRRAPGCDAPRTHRRVASSRGSRLGMAPPTGVVRPTARRSVAAGARPRDPAARLADRSSEARARDGEAAPRLSSTSADRRMTSLSPTVCLCRSRSERMCVERIYRATGAPRAEPPLQSAEWPTRRRPSVEPTASDSSRCSRSSAAWRSSRSSRASARR